MRVFVQRIPMTVDILVTALQEICRTQVGFLSSHRILILICWRNARAYKFISTTDFIECIGSSFWQHKVTVEQLNFTTLETLLNFQIASVPTVIFQCSSHASTPPLSISRKRILAVFRRLLQKVVQVCGEFLLVRIKK